MYPIERILRTLKQYVRNKARHKWYFIAEAYVMNKLRSFCSSYLSGIETRFTRDERNNKTIPEDEVIGEFEIFKQKIHSLGVSSLRTLSKEEKCLFYWYMLNNVIELCKTENLSHYFLSLAMEPSFDVCCYNGCIVDGLKFHTSECDSWRTTQNNGVMVISESDVSGSGTTIVSTVFWTKCCTFNIRWEELFGYCVGDVMFLEFVKDLDNPVRGLSSVDDNLGTAQPSATLTPRRRVQSRLLELERYVHANGRIPMLIAHGVEKPILSHIIRSVSQAISVCVQKTFLVYCLKRADVGREYIKIVKDNL
ncbi:CACTA en-spm transposon protein [Cucumis melo var. makuwa]|uniref:CACTA en-spm transposon protein n=1 Tax=Cucumis melo var. makuwa TaxID=1194695 RepID=A0A5D3CM99_CUCMM|nr:CACTA en-spm transposon protein [Cucumis melo var. makuwa]TYK12254.1 CACTA en-spm transposon protein [Cucumis melo var. makuwa]